MSYLQDHLGSTSRLINALNAQNQASYDYTSYGKLEDSNGSAAANSTLTNPYTYTGREDDGTGLMYYRARYYDPERIFEIDKCLDGGGRWNYTCLNVSMNNDLSPAVGRI